MGQRGTIERTGSFWRLQHQPGNAAIPGHPSRPSTMEYSSSEDEYSSDVRAPDQFFRFVFGLRMSAREIVYLVPNIRCLLYYRMMNPGGCRMNCGIWKMRFRQFRLLATMKLSEEHQMLNQTMYVIIYHRPHFLSCGCSLQPRHDIANSLC
jgi:hypothetical protein